jgi:hypothetical protein
MSLFRQILHAIQARLIRPLTLHALQGLDGYADDARALMTVGP